jgi:hypothetical protein
MPNNNPLRAQLWLEVLPEPPAPTARYMVWAGEFRHEDVQRGFTFLSRVFTPDRFEAIIADLAVQMARARSRGER